MKRLLTLAVLLGIAAMLILQSITPLVNAPSVNIGITADGSSPPPPFPPPPPRPTLGGFLA